MINWNIVSVDTRSLNGRKNVVTMVRWVCKVSDAGKTAVQLGATALGAPGSGFIEFDKLTEANLLSFCWGNGLEKSVVEAKAQDALEQALSAPDSPALPWTVVAEEQLVG